MSKKQHTRIISLVTAVFTALMLLTPAFTCPAVAAGAANGLFVFEAEQVSKDEAVFTVKLAANSYICSAMLSISFNKSLLTFASASNSPASDSFVTVAGLKSGSASTCVVAFIAPRAQAAATEVATLRFKVNGTASADCAFVVTADELFTCNSSDKEGNNPVDATASFTRQQITCPLNVKVSEIRLSYTDLTLAKGQTVQLTAQVLPLNVLDKSVSWSIINGDCATLSATGLLTAVKDGSCTVKATCADGSKSAECAVEVVSADSRITAADLNSDNIRINSGYLYLSKAQMNVSSLTALFISKGLEVRSDSGKLASSAPVATGMTLVLVAGGKDMDTLKIIVLGDVNGDADVTTDDARLTLRNAVGLEGFDATQKLAADTAGNDSAVTTDDARLILRAAVGIDKINLPG